MQENCHGALPLSRETKGRGSPGTEYYRRVENPSDLSHDLGAREEENRPPNEAQLRGFITTADACVLMWHRVGGRNFTYLDVKDLLRSPSQLIGMENRGYVRTITGPGRRGENYTSKVYQLTDQVQHLAQVREGMFR